MFMWSFQEKQHIHPCTPSKPIHLINTITVMQHTEEIFILS